MEKQWSLPHRGSPRREPRYAPPDYDTETPFAFPESAVTAGGDALRIADGRPDRVRSLRKDRDWPTAMYASDLYDAGYQVFLFIDANLLRGHDRMPGSHYPDRWVAMSMGIDSPDDFAVFSWGFGEFGIPQGPPLAREEFLKHFYGFIAARF